MTEARKRNLTRWSIESVLLALTAVAVLTIFWFWAYVWAWWVFSDPSPLERTAYFREALERDGVPARLERGRMIRLRRGDVAEIGASECAARSIECSEYSGRRRGCREAKVWLSCTYAVKHRSGSPTTAVVRLHSNPEYQAPESPRAKPFVADGAPNLNEADDMLCGLGHWCRPAGDQEERSSEPPAPPRAAPRREASAHDADIAAAPADAAAR